MGAKFVEPKVDTAGATAEGGYAKEVSEDTKRRLQEALTESVSRSDVVITTAQVPGKKAPVLVTRGMVDRMKPGSVIVDLAAEQGGNVEGSRAGETTVVNGVRILGPVNLPSAMPAHASQLFSRNAHAFIGLLVKEGQLNIDMNDDIIKGACVARSGVVVNERVKALL